MQDIHSRGGGAGRLFGGGIEAGIGGGGGGDRRIRAHHHSYQDQALKCPRCDSLNTKFCYYNNYNLSQPRHFCKNCRRYWTKGGVLRNVPVGGGCRKAKRAKFKHSDPDATAAATVEPSGNEEKEGNSSSDSSSVTASNSMAAVAAEAVNSTAVVSASASTSAAEVVSEHSSVPVTGFLDGANSSKWYGNGAEWTALLGQGSSGGGIMPEMGSLTSLIATSSNEMTQLGFGGDTVKQQCVDQKVEGVTGGLFDDQTAQVDFPCRSSDPNEGFGALVDWTGCGGDQGLFDLTNTVDHAYWSQTQWTTDYLP